MALDLIASSIGCSGRLAVEQRERDGAGRGDPDARRLIEPQVDRQHAVGVVDTARQLLVR